MAETQTLNIALLIDADNASPAAIDPVLTVLAELGQVNIRRAYGNFAKDNLSRWDKITNKFAIRPQQQFDVSKGKNATDMAMTIDAIDLVQAYGMEREREGRFRSAIELAFAAALARIGARAWLPGWMWMRLRRGCPSSGRLA